MANTKDDFNTHPTPYHKKMSGFTPYHAESYGCKAVDECTRLGPRLRPETRMKSRIGIPKGIIPKPRLSRRGTGFTLIEVIFSIFILTIAVGGIFIFLPGILKLSKKALNETYVAQLAQKTMEEIKQQRDSLKPGVYPPLDEAPFSFEEPYAQFRYRMYIEEESPEELLKVAVRVIWQEGPEVKSKDFTTFISK
jgi:type II secretory pathway pseudopilin PulG